MRSAAWLLLAPAALAVLAVALVSPLAVALLYHRDRPAQVDALVVLGGEAWVRGPLAAELFHQGVAPLLLLSGRGDYVWEREGLIARGVPPDRILVETRSASTRENALFSAPILREHGLKRIALATSWQHSARALRTFRAFAPDLSTIVLPTSPPAGWIKLRGRGDARRVYAEYVKSIFYCIAYRVCPGAPL